jgi:transcriptional regulator with XRE-family HTH domain
MVNIEGNLGTTIKNARQSLKFSIRELARRSEISPTAVWKIERGQMSPSVGILYRIARGLGIKLTELIESIFEGDSVICTRSGSRLKGPIDESRDLVEVLSGTTHDWTIIAAEHTLRKGASSGKQSLSHSGEELVYCLKGQVQFLINGQTYNLKAGDSLHFKSHLPHYWYNINGDTSQMLVIVVPPRPDSAVTRSEPNRLTVE